MDEANHSTLALEEIRIAPTPIMLDADTIEAVVNEYCSSSKSIASQNAALDDAIREYLVQLLLSHDDDFDDDYDYDDDDGDAWGEARIASLVETVAQFIDSIDIATLIVQKLAAAARSANDARKCLQQEVQRQPVNILSISHKTEEIATTKTYAENETSKTINDMNSPPRKVTTSRIEQRKERRKEQHQKKIPAFSSGAADAATTSVVSREPCGTEDESSAWLDCLAQEQAWGGRGKGGRGAYAGRVNSIQSNIHLTNLSLSLPNGGVELLTDTTMDIVRGHRYGLVGRNGVGKSTLLRRLAARAIPGMPHNMRVLLVEQQQYIPNVSSSSLAFEESSCSTQVTSLSAVQTLVLADWDRTNLLEEQALIESELQRDESSDTTFHLMQAFERLSVIAAELDAIRADTAEDRANEILEGMQFTESMRHSPVSNLSGGWRMRLALARALFLSSNDLICLDEATNHLDLSGLDWLINFINNSDKTLIVVSHDRVFLDSVCTDIVVMEHQKLTYFVGSYSMYEQQQYEKSTRESQILDAAERQRSQAQAFVQKQQAASNKKSADPNKQRQAKMIREKKMDRIGNYREDGKRYKLRSLKTLDEKSVRLAQKVKIEVDEPVIKMFFPDPTWPPSIGPTDTIVRMEHLSFGYDADKVILKDVTLSLDRGSKIALVGPNGCGKSSFVKLIAGDHSDPPTTTQGNLWIHPNLRIGHVTQYTVEELEAHASETVVEYAERKLKSGRASAEIIAKASGNVRQYLGAFGLGGKHSLRQIGNLSGGERMRLCFAAVLAENPGLLLLDESSNHCDMTLLESMADALKDFKGSVLMVSHNQAFLSGFCQELWVLEDGHITVNHSDTASFDDMFSQYRRSVGQRRGQSSYSDRRRQKTRLAKRATTQRAGTQHHAVLL